MKNITVYGTPSCPNCKTVTSFLDSVEADYSYLTIGQDVTKQEVDDQVGRSVRAVPVIVHEGTEVSFDDLRRKASANEMSSALAAMSL